MYFGDLTTYSSSSVIEFLMLLTLFFLSFDFDLLPPLLEDTEIIFIFKTCGFSSRCLSLMLQQSLWQLLL